MTRKLLLASFLLLVAGIAMQVGFHCQFSPPPPPDDPLYMLDYTPPPEAILYEDRLALMDNGFFVVLQLARICAVLAVVNFVARRVRRFFRRGRPAATPKPENPQRIHPAILAMMREQQEAGDVQPEAP